MFKLSYFKCSIICVLFFSIISCATQKIIYDRPGLTIEQFNRDKYDCTQESKTYWSGGGTGSMGIAMIIIANSSAEKQANEMFKMCMEARGYTAREVSDEEDKQSSAKTTTADLVKAKEEAEKKHLEYEAEINKVGTPAFCAKNANGYDKECNRNTNINTHNKQ